MAYRLEANERVAAGIRRLIVERLGQSIDDLTNPKKDRDKGVHDARKNCKRIRAALRLVRNEIGDALYRQENARIRDAAQLLSGARDSWVLIRTLDKLTADHAAQLPKQAFAGVRQNLVENYDKTLASHQGQADLIPEIVASLRAALEQAKTLPIQGDDFSVFQPGLRQTYFRGRRALRLAYQSPSMEAFHEWRKRIKYLWYQLEILAGSWPNLLDHLAEELHTLSEYIGDDHDLGVLRQVVLQELAGFHSPHEMLALISLIDQKRLVLQAQARPLGERLYCDAEQVFVARLAAYWKAWRDEDPLNQARIMRQIQLAVPGYLTGAAGLLTTAQLAVELGIAPEQVRKLIRERKLPAEKVGSIWIIQVGAPVMQLAATQAGPAPGNLVSTRQAALRLNLRPEKIRELIQAGRLPAIKAGRNWVIQESALQGYLERGASSG